MFIDFFCASQASGSGSNLIPETPPNLQTVTSSPPLTPSPASETRDTLTIAEKTKEEGNAAFKTGQYQSAVDLYTKAIGKRL